MFILCFLMVLLLFFKIKAIRDFVSIIMTPLINAGFLLYLCMSLSLPIYYFSLKHSINQELHDVYCMCLIPLHYHYLYRIFVKDTYELDLTIYARNYVILMIILGIFMGLERIVPGSSYYENKLELCIKYYFFLPYYFFECIGDIFTYFSHNFNLIYLNNSQQVDLFISNLFKLSEILCLDIVAEFLFMIVENCWCLFSMIFVLFTDFSLRLLNSFCLIITVIWLVLMYIGDK